MIIDGHCHIGPHPEYAYTAEKLVESMDEEGVDKAIVFSFVDAINNDYVANAAKKFSDRLIGFACINPMRERAREELMRSIEFLGLKGIKLHPSRHGYAPSNHRIVDPILKICAEFKIPIIIHGGDDLLTHPFEIEEMAKGFPEVTVIIAHAGFMWLCDQARMVAKRNNNILLDTAALIQGEITANVKEVGASKVVMGTDKPVGGSAQLALKMIELAVPNKQERNLIAGGNYAKLLKLM